MSKRPAIALSLMLSALLLAGMTACNRADSDRPQAAAPVKPPAPETTSRAEPPQSRQERRAAIRRQIETVLTPDQIKQLATKMPPGARIHQVLAELNLTADQKAKVQEIFKAAWAKRQKATPAAAPP